MSKKAQVLLENEINPIPINTMQSVRLGIANALGLIFVLYDI